MPVIKSAKKKLKQDKKRKERRMVFESAFKEAVKKARKTPSEKLVREATKLIDKASKKHIIHKNKGARIKSSLSKLLPKTATNKVRPKSTVKSTGKTAKKLPMASKKQ